MSAGGRAAALAERLVAEIMNLLRRERDLLVSGRFADLARAAATREAQLARLAALEPDALRPLARQLDGLREAAGRNATLLRAAMDGAAAARRRLAALSDAAAPLASYDASGAPVLRGAAPVGGRRA